LVINYIVNCFKCQELKQEKKPPKIGSLAYVINNVDI